MKPAHRLPSNPRAEPFAQAVRSARTPSALSPLPLAAKNCHHRVPPSTPAFTSDAETTVPHGCAVAQPETCPFPIQAPARRKLFLLPLHSSTAQTSHPSARRALVSPDHPESRLAPLRQAHPLRLTKGAPSSHPPRVPAERVVVFLSHFAGGTQGTAPIGPDGSWSGLWKRGAGQPGRQPVADDRASVRPGWVLGAGCLPGELLPLPSSPAFARCSLCGRGARSA